jgi:hypothetical protein
MIIGQKFTETALLPYEDPMEQQKSSSRRTKKFSCCPRPSLRKFGHNNLLSTRDWRRFVRIFGAKLVLEVFGAAGTLFCFFYNTFFSR